MWVDAGMCFETLNHCLARLQHRAIWTRLLCKYIGIRLSQGHKLLIHSHKCMGFTMWISLERTVVHCLTHNQEKDSYITRSCRFIFTIVSAKWVVSFTSGRIFVLMWCWCRCLVAGIIKFVNEVLPSRPSHNSPRQFHKTTSTK